MGVCFNCLGVALNLTTGSCTVPVWFNQLQGKKDGSIWLQR